VFDAAGNLYGTANGDLANGEVFELVRSSTGWSGKTIYSFANLLPGNLAIDALGKLYGTLSSGGPDGIFQLSRRRNGKWTENSLCDGCAATGIPVFDQAGNLFVDARDQVLELVRNQSWSAIIITEFSGRDGSDAAGALTFDANGKLYGTTVNGGEIGSCLEGLGCGTAFRLTPRQNGRWNHEVLYRFKGRSDGEQPSGGMIFDQAGNLYGTTTFGGDPVCSLSNDGGCGTVFELAVTSDGHWEHSVLDRLGLGDGKFPFGLIADDSGNLYGADSGGGCGTVYELTPSANAGWKERILYQFKCSPSDGREPMSSMIFDSAGNLYGTTVAGGGSSSCYLGCGTVFQLAPSSSGAWTERVLYSFTGKRDGDFPVGGLIFDAAGNLYGTTEYGGGGQCKDNNDFLIGCGIVYELSPTSQGKWKETSLHTFTDTSNDGAFPAAALIFDEVGNLYGTTAEGGNGPCVNYGDNLGCGTAFQLSIGSGGVWTETVLYSFPGGNADPSFSNGLTMDSQGNLYGTTVGGTSTYCSYGCGTVYQLVPSSGGGWTPTVLYNFGGFKGDGNLPLGPLTFDKSGNLFGTTSGGGSSSSCYNGCGTVFQLSPSSAGSWTESVTYSFNGPAKDGAAPQTGVIFDAAGNIYGTTPLGGVDEGLYTPGGTVFEIKP
jgi:uncharacterized repeat protein (TIGR03803 family)